MSANTAMMQMDAGSCSCSFWCNMAYTEKQIKEWIKKRFGYFSESYFNTWLLRFQDGTAYKFMDDTSRQFWMEIRTASWT
jgi:hypothetical protein